ncbi:MAG TPA: DivIVA domain-containing protein [Micromonosporaceae bacterium]
MSSQGQRFRRRALRRGYKVDEVDDFLDRVEATLAGEPIPDPVTAQEVHDVVFRVRFGGYDEWQVDLHLDRVERQLAEMEERGATRPQAAPMPSRVPPPERIGPPVGHAPAPPPRDDRFAAPPAPRDDRFAAPPLPARAAQGFAAPPASAPTQGFPAVPSSAPTQGFPAVPPPAPPVQPAPQPRPPVIPRLDPSAFSGSTFNGFEPGRHGKADMTTEMRVQSASPPPGVSASDIQYVDEMRRAFQPRRFGSGYDPGQVDRLFEGIMAALTGRSPVPITDGELDPAQFSLVPNGYFEAEVDHALREVREILRRR